MTSTAARVSSRLPPVGMMKSARARFSASGICRARIASSFASVMPGRASTRARWISAGAETTTTLSTRFSPPVSNSSGTSNTHQRRIGMRRDKGGAFLAHRRVDQRLEPLQRPRIGQHRLAEQGPVDTLGPGRVRKHRLDRRDESPAFALEPMHRRIRIEHRHTELLEHRGDGRLAHADRPGGQSPGQESA